MAKKGRNAGEEAEILAWNEAMASVLAWQGRFAHYNFPAVHTDLLPLKETIASHQPRLEAVRAEMARNIVGQEHLIERLLIGLLANGHVLLEGVPGLAKTATVNALAQCLHLKFSRVQFTPDLLPGDLPGNLVFNPRDNSYHTRKGPIFANLVLADEINRAPAKVQSALLEAMQERQDIGTAKPLPEERERIRHHMIDIVPPSEPFSAGRYIAMIVPVIERLLSKGQHPLIVGGTGLYIKAMTRGICDAPDADEKVRVERLAAEQRQKGTLYDQLKSIDPEAAARITPGDERRIVRALEVYQRVRQPISVLQMRETRPLPYSYVKIGLTRERVELYRMIDERVDTMFRRGLVDEVERLLGMNPCRTAFQRDRI